MTRRRPRLLALAVPFIAAGCIELSSPTSEIESVSTVLAAYPAVVRGDTLRDSSGVARRLELVAFTGRGDTVPDPEGVLFIIPDTTEDARVVNGWLIAGDSLGPVRVFGQVAGLQTPARTIEVVPAPTAAQPNPASLGNPATLAVLRYRPEQATTTSAALEVRVQGDTGGVPVNVNGWVVTYRIVEQPERNPALESGLPAFFTGPPGRDLRPDSTVAADTTSAGLASRTLVIRPSYLASFTAVDTVVVEATVRHRGAHVPGSPIVFRVPLAPQE